MCDVCGCGDTKIVPVEIQENLMAANDHTAAHNRAHLRRHGQVGINLMGSPGAGKTALLEAVARRAGGRLRLAALTGDLETDNDARRVRAAGIDAVSITTGTACHLDAEMVHRALHRHFDDAGAGVDYLFIENVGNLVCPAIYDLGQEANVVALSVTEGEDKPLKYPVMFRRADLVLLTKTDLLPALPEFDRAALEDALARVMPQPRLLAVSARTGDGIADLIDWLEERRAVATSAHGPNGGALAESHDPRHPLAATATRPEGAIHE
jgi:hydrogenase nickel incorporation protein HypB